MTLPSPDELRRRTNQFRSDWLERFRNHDLEEFDMEGCRTMKEYMAKKATEGAGNDQRTEHPLP